MRKGKGSRGGGGGGEPDSQSFAFSATRHAEQQLRARSSMYVLAESYTKRLRTVAESVSEVSKQVLLY